MEDLLDLLAVGDQKLDDLGPGLVETLVPDAGGEIFSDFDFLKFGGVLLDELFHFGDSSFPVGLGNSIDFVHEDKDI